MSSKEAVCLQFWNKVEGRIMAQDKKVEQITSMEDDFAQWYTDICKKAELSLIHI